MALYRVLQKSNLTSYYQAFMNQVGGTCAGGDDLRQLAEASDEDIQEVLRLVGMLTKPLHVIRFKKVLKEWKANPDKFMNDSEISTNVFTMNDPLRNYMNISAFQPGASQIAHAHIVTPTNHVTTVQTGNDWSNNNSLNLTNMSNPQVRGIPVNLLPNATLTENERMNIESAAEDLIKAIPEYPIKDPSPSRKNEAGLYEVIKMALDNTSRMPAIYRYSAIYGRFNKARKTGKPMNHHEVAVNEASAQLSLRMPSLLSRREDLYPLARQVVKIAEDSWKSNYRSRSHKKKKTNPNIVAIAMEFSKLHQTNPQVGYVRAQEKIELAKNQLVEMVAQQDNLRLAFREARNNPAGPTMADIQKEIDNLCAIQQEKILEIGRYVLELRRFRRELSQTNNGGGGGGGGGGNDAPSNNNFNNSSVVASSNGNKVFTSVEGRPIFTSHPHVTVDSLASLVNSCVSNDHNKVLNPSTSMVMALANPSATYAVSTNSNNTVNSTQFPSFTVFTTFGNSKTEMPPVSNAQQQQQQQQQQGGGGGGGNSGVGSEANASAVYQSSPYNSMNIRNSS